METSGEPDTTSRHNGRQMNCYKGRQMTWRHAESRTPPARLGDKWIAIRADKWIGDIRRAGHHQPDWETNESLYGETNELETSGEPDGHQPDWETNESLYGETNELETAEQSDTTSQTGRQMNRYMGRQKNWRQPESRTPPARLGDKWIAISGDKSIGDSRRAGRHQPDWETNESLYAETNELETAEEPDTTSQTGRQMSRYMRRQMNWRHAESRRETNESLYGETHELETAGEPDTTSQTGRQMNCYMGRQMNWRQPKSRTPPARLGDKWIVIWGDKWIGDSRRAGHHQPDWETNELLYGETNEFGKSGEPDTTSQTRRRMNRYMGRQMNWRHRESRTPPARLGDKWIVIWGDKWIGDIGRAGHHQPDRETNESLYGETNELEAAEEPDTTSQTGRQMNC